MIGLVIGGLIASVAATHVLKINRPGLLRPDDRRGARRTGRQLRPDPAPVGAEEAGQPLPGLRADDPHPGDHHGVCEDGYFTDDRKPTGVGLI